MTKGWYCIFLGSKWLDVADAQNYNSYITANIIVIEKSICWK